VSEGTHEKSVHEGTSEGRIVNELWRMANGQGLNAQMMAFQAEITHRNNVALRAFNASSDLWSSRLYRLTVMLVVLTGVLALFTIALIAIAIESMNLAWVLLERTAR